MQDNVIDRIFADNKLLTSYLGSVGEWSMQSNVDGGFRKVLILSAASYFETHLTDNLIRIFSDITNDSEPMVEFLKNKGISRQYHSFFQWENRNANNFFGLFGPSFKQHMQSQVTSDPAFDSSIKSFLELGQLRNKLVHLNFANFPLDKTVDEIYALYTDAQKFVEAFPLKLREFLESAPPETG